jgi:hypothetical protein
VRTKLSLYRVSLQPKNPVLDLFYRPPLGAQDILGISPQIIAPPLVAASIILV